MSRIFKNLTDRERVGFAAVLGLCAAVVAAVTDNLHADWLAFGFLGFITVFTLTNLVDYTTRKKPETPQAVKIVYGKEALLNLYSKMKSEARSLCYFSWAGNYNLSNKELEKYFQEENQELLDRIKAGKQLNIRRLITLLPENVSEQEFKIHENEMDEAAHKEQVYDYLKSNDVQDYEIAYADVEDPQGVRGSVHSAVFVLLNSTKVPQIGFYFDGRRDVETSGYAERIRNVFLADWNRGESF